MVWFRDEDDGYSMLTVRGSGTRYELPRLSPQGSEVLEAFECSDEAVRRWNQMEDCIRARSRMSGTSTTA
jgi:hypothetical protein